MKTKTKSILLLISLIHHNLSAQTFYFDPYLALTGGDQKGVRITREQALEMIKLPSYKVELEKALNVDAEAFVKSGTSEFVPYEEYMVFLAAKNIKNVTDKAFIEGALAPNCDHLTSERKENTFANLRIQNTFRGRLLSNQLDMALEDLKKEGNNISPELAVSIELLSPGVAVGDEVKLSNEEKKQIIEGIENKQLIERALNGDKSVDYEKIVSVISSLNLNSKVIKEAFNDDETAHLYNFTQMPLTDQTALLKKIQDSSPDVAFYTTVLAVGVAAALAVGAAYAMKTVKGDLCMVRDISSPRDIRPPPRRTPFDGDIPNPRMPSTAP